MSPAINPPFVSRGQLGSRPPPQAPSPPSPPSEAGATTAHSNVSNPGAVAGTNASTTFVASAVAKSSAANSSPSHRHSFGTFAPAADPVLAYKPLPPRPLSTMGESGAAQAPPAAVPLAVPLSAPSPPGQPISIPPDVLLHASNTAAVASTTPPNGTVVTGATATTAAQVVENYHGGQHYHHHHHHHHHHFHPSPSTTSLNGAFQTVSPPEDLSPRPSFDVPRQAALQVTIPSRGANTSSDSFGGHGVVSGGIPLTANSPFPLTSAPIPPPSMFPSGGNSRNSSVEFVLQAQPPVTIPNSGDPTTASPTTTASSQLVTSTASTVTVVNLSPMSPVTLEPASCSTSNSGSPSSSSESLAGQGGAHHAHPASSPRSPSLSTASLRSVGTSSPLARGSIDYHQPLSSGSAQPAPHFRRRSSSNHRTSQSNLVSSPAVAQPSLGIPHVSASSPSLANATLGSSSRASAAPSNTTASPSSGAAAAQAAAAAAASYVLTRVDNAGNVTDQYIVGNCIGRGSYGAVFRAIHMESHHTVAIKRFALADRKQMESILKEVRKMESLDHPNVVKYLGYVQTDADFNIILEYVENGSLASTLKHFGPLPERVVGSIVCKVLQGLVYLHDRGLKHLDLKAANILTTKDGCVKLSDFGVSQSSVDTSSDKFVGSAYWMAPEVITLEGTHTASDIWSLGCTIIELLTGLPPYFDLLAMSALYKIVEDGCPPFPEGISPLLKNFLSSCFRKDFQERATARALLEHQWMIPFVHMVGAMSGLAIVGPPPVPARPDLVAVQMQQQQQVAHVSSAPNLTVDVSQLPPMATSFKRQAPPPPSSSEVTSPGAYPTPLTVVSEPTPVTPSPSPAVSSSQAEPSHDIPIPRARTPAPPRASLDARPSSMLVFGRPSTPSKSAPSSPAGANPRQAKEFYPPVTLTPMSATRQQSPLYPSRTPPPAPTLTPSPLAVSVSRTPTLKRSQSAGSSITGGGTKSNRSSILPAGTKDALQALMGSRSRTKSSDGLPTSGSRSPPAANLSRRSSDHMLVAPRFFAPPPPPSVPPSANDPSTSLLSKSAPTKPGFVVPLTAPPPPVPPTSLARSLAHKWVKATFASVVLCANCKQQIRKGRVCHDCSTAVCKPCANGEDGRKGMVCNVSSYRYSMVSVASIQGTDSLIGPQSVSGPPHHHPHLQHQQHLQQRAPARKTRAPLSNLIGSSDLAALSESMAMSTSPSSAETRASSPSTPEGTLDKKPAHKRSGLMMGLVSPGKRPSFLASSREELPQGGKGVERRGSSAKLDSISNGGGGASGPGSVATTAERVHPAGGVNGRPKAREDCVVM